MRSVLSGIAVAAIAVIGLAQAANADALDDIKKSGKIRIAVDLGVPPYDEVTSALDPELTAEVLGVMENLAHHSMTMISVTHAMGFARRVADVVVFMHQGKVWETGPTAEVFANPRTAEFKQFVGSEL